MKGVEALKWRYATKKFDSTKKVSDEDLKTLLESANLAATSFGLQGLKVIVVTDESIKEELQVASWNQQQLTTCSHVLVFCSNTKVDEDLAQAYMERVSATRGAPMEALDGFKSTILGFAGNMGEEKVENWLARQAYIALGTTMMMAAEMQIDSCPMEGFNNQEYNRILGINEDEWTSTVVLPIGYRHPEDDNQNFPKVRKSLDDFVDYR